MNIVFIAPPAAGKGTQAKLLSDDYNLYHLSTGDLLREVANSNTELGNSIKKLIDNGDFISDELMFKLIKEKINSLTNNNGIIFDGVPRTLKQVELLNSMLSSINQKVDYVLYLDIDKDIAEKRVTGRLSCPNCHSVYNIHFDSFLNHNKCNNCNSELVKREDDTLEKFNYRFDTYIYNTKPVVDYYSNLGLLNIIKNEGTKYDIYKNIKSIIDKDNSL